MPTKYGNLRKKFSSSSDDYFDLLTKLLSLNPNKRINAKDALDHKYFDSIRNREKEIFFENLNTISFDEFEYEKEDLNMGKLKTYYLSEIVKYKNDFTNL